ncbi:MAG: HAMP domain-containing sensor histidine kinase [Candidatus Omnitrophota bacterium]|nr:HAMP domain-containing histidine kinase [Candidatus Omnitrophota bacterium]MBU1928260.1 HAMP domain-containing histidine kinase [Candidatus Omnitrophota bacterium]MBU2034928.1 HAMP domain-containing histidine kinase [Candidatus Omnitrophota bacterium]MBU2222303.1 HAMP domain-containing histidine kinase [Candidatus Omnitrophota bacterium]MBU2257652.1 HAMP domain-containing histidine kinase [Candidatus Omnitrophota bacterium]
MHSSVYIIWLIIILTTVILIILLISQVYKVKGLKGELEKTKKSIDEMDEQAKLILRTDLELNKTHEELDRKMTSINALQNISRAISTTLEETQIFKSIREYHIKDMGFEKALVFLWDQEEKKFSLNLSLGYPQEKIDPIINFVNANKDYYLLLIKREMPITLYSKNEDRTVKDKIMKALDVGNFIISPILPKEGSKGLMFVGTGRLDTAKEEGDDESIAILANQLGQSLENARLFEKTWAAQQELEKRVEERTRELSRVLEEVNTISKRKTDFVSSVSHELRTPLTSIKGYASLLLSGKFGALPEDVKLRLAKLNNHTDELVQFINDLLDISRIESGKVAMQQGRCDIKKMVDEVSDLLSILLKEKRIEFSYSIAEDAKYVLADAAQIKRVFINIINNALKFTTEQGKITLKSCSTPEGIQIDIADNGCGMPEEAQNKIFEEFYRVDNLINQQLRGTGLGLTLVKNIIEAHKGRIWVKSYPGQGSTFSFLLPPAA